MEVFLKVNESAKTFLTHDFQTQTEKKRLALNERYWRIQVIRQNQQEELGDKKVGW